MKLSERPEYGQYAITTDGVRAVYYLFGDSVEYEQYVLAPVMVCTSAVCTVTARRGSAHPRQQCRSTCGVRRPARAGEAADGLVVQNPAAGELAWQPHVPLTPPRGGRPWQ